MVISLASSVNSVYEQQGVQNQGHTSKNPAPAKQSTDTVHLSPAATAHLASADADGDGDGH
jgi:hypothetical protein